MMHPADSISVVIPLYNKGLYISRAIASVLRCFESQPGNYELIIVDDGSTDNGADVARSFSAQIAGLRIIRQENQGVSVARNRGVECSSSEFVAFLDADDRWLPNFISSIRQLIQQFPQADAFGTSYAIASSNGKIRVPVFTECPHGSGIIADYFAAASSGYSPICSSAVCMRRSVFHDVGGFVPGETHGEDKSLYARFALSRTFAWTDEVCAIRHLDASHRSTDRRPVAGNRWSFESAFESMAATGLIKNEKSVRGYLGFHLLVDARRHLRAWNLRAAFLLIWRAVVLSRGRAFVSVVTRLNGGSRWKTLPADFETST